MSVWNPSAYLRGAYGSNRLRAAVDLLSQTKAATQAANLNVQRVLDLGCGLGNVTPLLQSAFPNAFIHGIDSSQNMINVANKNVSKDHSFNGFVHYSVGDISQLFKDKNDIELHQNPDLGLDLVGRYDVIYSNAALHWVNEHDKLIPLIINNLLNTGGVFAFQIPDTKNQPSHVLMQQAVHNLCISGDSTKRSVPSLYTKMFGSNGSTDDIFNIGNNANNKKNADADAYEAPAVRIPRMECEPVDYAKIIYSAEAGTGAAGAAGAGAAERVLSLDHWNTEYMYHLPITPVSVRTDEAKGPERGHGHGRGRGHGHGQMTEEVERFVWPSEHPVCGFTRSTGLMPITDYLEKYGGEPLVSRFMCEYNSLLYDEYVPRSQSQCDSSSFSSCSSSSSSSSSRNKELQFNVLFPFKRYFCVVTSKAKKD